MAYDNSPNADSTDRRPPLVWCDTEDDSDVSVHLGNARSIAGMLIAVDGHHNLDTLPQGSVCTLMCLLDQELKTIHEILEQGDAS